MKWTLIKTLTLAVLDRKQMLIRGTPSLRDLQQREHDLRHQGKQRATRQLLEPGIPFCPEQRMPILWHVVTSCMPFLVGIDESQEET